jgi:microcystin-dependent protein
MSDPFVAEIIMFPGNFAPAGWAFCNGQLLPTSQNTTLFALLGTMYGGDGASNFALPDLQGRAPMHAGSLAGTTYDQGVPGGSDAVVLTSAGLPSHSHTATFHAYSGKANKQGPDGNVWAQAATNQNAFYSDAPPDTVMDDRAIGSSSAQPHYNMQPYLTLNFVIALQGVFPTRP